MRHFNIFTGSIASGATQSTLTFSMGRAFDKIYLQRATMASVSTIYVYGGMDGSIYNQVVDAPTSGIVFSTQAFEIDKTSSGFVYAIPVGFPYYRIQVQSAQTDGLAMKLICSGD